jgi:hypothetical protein
MEVRACTRDRICTQCASLPGEPLMNSGSPRRSLVLHLVDLRPAVQAALNAKQSAPPKFAYENKVVPIIDAQEAPERHDRLVTDKADLVVALSIKSGHD